MSKLLNIKELPITRQPGKARECIGERIGTTVGV